MNHVKFLEASRDLAINLSVGSTSEAAAQTLLFTRFPRVSVSAREYPALTSQTTVNSPHGPRWKEVEAGEVVSHVRFHCRED
jgi:hypothetical protein